MIVRAAASVVSVMALLPSFRLLAYSHETGASHYRRVKAIGSRG
jgi:hypothetical protein